MLTVIFDLAMEVSPRARQWLLRFWYQMLSQIDTTGVMLYMNYGYADLHAAAVLALHPNDEPDRYCIQLYHHVTSAIDLHQRDVLEVGSGRGGGAAFLMRYVRPRSLTGVDLSDQAIRFCTARHHATGARFVPGHAQRLPFQAMTFDAAVNIESSHCYPSTEQFLLEVNRVLRPDGYLLYADYRDSHQVKSWREQMTRAGFYIEDERNITPNIVQSLDLDHHRRLALIEQHAPRLLRERLGRFAGLRGSPIYEDFRTGKLEYRSFVLRKHSL